MCGWMTRLPAGAGDPLAGAGRAAPGRLPRLRLARVGGRQRVAAARVPEPLHTSFFNSRNYCTN